MVSKVIVCHLLGGDDGIRTHDPLLAGQVLSQLSYTPIIIWFVVFSFFQSRGTVFRSLLCVGIELSSRTVSRKVFSPLQSLTSVFGMGTGGPSAFETLTVKKVFPLLFTMLIENRIKGFVEFETQVTRLNKSSSPRSISISQLNTLLCLHP